MAKKIVLAVAGVVAVGAAAIGAILYQKRKYYY